MGPFAAPVESALPVMLLLRLQPELMRWKKENPEVKSTTEERAAKARGGNAPPKGHSGPWRQQRGAQASPPRLRAFPFLAAPRYPGARQDSQELRLWSQKDLSLSQAQSTSWVILGK